MNRRADSIDLHDVERAIVDGFRLLRFESSLERRFESDVNEDRCRSMIRLNYIGIVIYHCFLFSDYRSVGDVFHIDLFVHFFIMTPLMLAVNVALAHRPPAWLREGLETAAVMILAVTVFIIVSVSRSPDRDVLSVAQCFLVLFSIMMQRTRFWYVVVLCVLILGLYGFSLAAMDMLSSERVLMLNFVFLGIVLFSLIGSYILEHELRMNYLLRLRDRFRNEQLEMASLRDALTGIGNRRALDSALERLPTKENGSSSKTAAILLLDIDHFKQFNDKHGHQEGDTCLRRVASIVEGCLRGSDQAAYRFGGEEFLVLLDDTSLDEALLVAERIRSNVEHAEFGHDPRTPSIVTVSIGVASGPIGRDAASDSLIAAADHALYRAKRQGRNRIMAANSNLPSDGALLAVA